jgi:hypothetical protein
MIARKPSGIADSTAGRGGSPAPAGDEASDCAAGAFGASAGPFGAPPPHPAIAVATITGRKTTSSARSIEDFRGLDIVGHLDLS